MNINELEKLAHDEWIGDDEDADLRHKLDRAIQMLEKLRNNYPKGGYSSSIQDEWDSLLEELNRR